MTELSTSNTTPNLPITPSAIAAQGGTRPADTSSSVETASGVPIPGEPPVIPSPIAIEMTTVQKENSDVTPIENPVTAETELEFEPEPEKEPEQGPELEPEPEPVSDFANLTSSNLTSSSANILLSNGAAPERTITSQLVVDIKPESLTKLNHPQNFELVQKSSGLSPMKIADATHIGESKSIRNSEEPPSMTSVPGQNANVSPAELRQSPAVVLGSDSKITEASESRASPKNLKRSSDAADLANTNSTLAPKRSKRDICWLKAEVAILEDKEAQSIRDLEEARQRKKSHKVNREVSATLSF